jgi:hypothetical protein
VWSKGIAAFVAGLFALAVTVTQLHDRLWPPVTVYGGEFVAVDLVALNVSYRAYVRSHPEFYPSRKIQDDAIENAGDNANWPGAEVAVVIRVEGLRNQKCYVRYRVYRWPLEPVVVPKSRQECSARVQSGDEGGWFAWVRLPAKKGRYFVRFDLYDGRGLLLGPGRSTRPFRWAGA